MSRRRKLHTPKGTRATPRTTPRTGPEAQALGAAVHRHLDLHGTWRGTLGGKRVTLRIIDGQLHTKSHGPA